LPPPLPTLPGNTNNYRLRREQFQAAHASNPVQNIHNNPVLSNPAIPQGFAFSQGSVNPPNPRFGKPSSSGGKRRKHTKRTKRTNRKRRETRRGRK